MKVKSEIKIYELNGKETVVGETTTLDVENVWNKNKCVLIKVGNQSVVVLAEDLRKAIDNATNNERY